GSRAEEKLSTQEPLVQARRSAGPLTLKACRLFPIEVARLNPLVSGMMMLDLIVGGRRAVQQQDGYAVLDGVDASAPRAGTRRVSPNDRLPACWTDQPV